MPFQLLSPGHGEGGWGMGLGTRISSFLGSRRRRVRCSPTQHVFSAAFGLAEDTGGVRQVGPENCLQLFRTPPWVLGLLVSALSSLAGP